MEEWDAVGGSSEMQEIPGLEGTEGRSITIEGVMDIGDYFAILEARNLAGRMVPFVPKDATGGSTPSATSLRVVRALFWRWSFATCDAAMTACSTYAVCSVSVATIGFAEEDAVAGWLYVCDSSVSWIRTLSTIYFEKGGLFVSKP